MGKTIYIDDGDALNIDRVIVNKPNTKWCKVLYSCDLIDEYEDRLKADMVAMLTEILTDFDNQIEPNSTRIDCESIIEQKIQALEEYKDETDKSSK